MRGEDGFSRVRGTCAHSSIGSSRKFLLYRLPKVISEMVGQTCRFAATTRRSSPTISEISFGNHSNPHPGNPGVLENQSLLTSPATIFSTQRRESVRRRTSV